MCSITRSCYDRRVSIKILSQNLFVTIFSTRNSCHHFLVSTSTLRSLSSPKPNSMLFPSREIANAIKHYLTSLFWHKINLIFSQNSNRFAGRKSTVDFSRSTYVRASLTIPSVRGCLCYYGSVQTSVSSFTQKC